MRNKIIIGAIVVLAGALIFENAYLLGRYHREKAQARAYTPYRQMIRETLPEIDLPAFETMRSWDPFSEMNKMQESMSSISLNNSGSAYIIKVEMPGMEKKDINIQAKGRHLMISGEAKANKTNKDKNYYSQESSSGNFLSSFLLPENAQVSRMASDYKDGVLIITIPRKERK